MSIRTHSHNCHFLHNIGLYHAPQGASFDVKSWSGSGGSAYALSVEKGTVSSTQSHGKIY